jgi:divinyl protochlorophyllide a 8-vinyl-reductase
VPARLFATLWACWPRPAASMVAREAGRRTADYVIAHRIPRLAQLLLSVAPRRLAARLLLQAIHRNAWTFAGSGHCAVTDCAPYLISITDNPLIMPDCTWHVAVFERLFDRLVARGTQVRQTACSCYGDPACRFEITLPVP